MTIKYKIIFVALCILFCSAASPAFSYDLKKLQTAGDNFKSDIPHSLLLNAGLGLSWSDAYIGQLVSVQPHFGYGISAGLSSVSAGVVKDVLNSFGADGGKGEAMMLPVILAETRFGGVLLPFDIGFKFGKLDDLSSSRLFLPDTKIDFMLVGGDLRTSIYKGGVVAPAISIGIGYNYLNGSLTTALSGSEFRIGDGKVLQASSPDMELFWEVNALDLKVQLSKKFKFFTPYIVAAGTFYWASAGYRLNGKLNYTGAWDAINADMAGAGINGISVDQNGFYSKSEPRTGIGTRILGGCSFNLFIFRLDCAAVYSFSDFNWGANAGLRVQV